MPDAKTAQALITELQSSAHLMTLETGVYCVHHSPGSTPPDPKTGLPGARLSVPPGASGQGVSIAGFRDDGWLGALDSAALIRVSQGPAQVLMTVYQDKHSKNEAPKLQVTRLIEGAPAINGAAQAARAQAPAGPAVGDAEVAAHVQSRGDVLARLGDWVGERASGRWVEGFALSPRRAEVSPQDIEYQAVLGRGWLSPWAEGGQFCGSRGMALPILGLRARLRGKAAETHALQVSGTFTDGSAIGPVASGEACEAASLAPLEAFCVALVPQPRTAARPSKMVAKPAAKPVVKPGAKPASPAKSTAMAKLPAKPAPRGRGR